MINPSAPGWVNKFLKNNSFHPESTHFSLLDFYLQLRTNGFIYGHIVGISTIELFHQNKWTVEEKSKLSLLIALHQIHQIEHNLSSNDDFLSKITEFYNHLYDRKQNFFTKLLPSDKPEVKLEKIIENRVQTNSNFISKNFSHIVTNALLFMDVLAFHYFLNGGQKPQNYLQEIESLLLAVVSNALHSKKQKTTYDDLLIKLFEASFRYSKFSDSSFKNIQMIDFELINTVLQKYYLLDMAVMAIWSDAVQDENETHFILELGEKLKISTQEIQKSMEDMRLFVKAYHDEIPYFNYSNPIKHFYDNASETVYKIMIRNKRRLTQEIMESGELVKLLAISTTRDLNSKEKKKVKTQLLDICKTVPSLTIFLLPGGSLLLPILIKFIPQLLPSSFNENLEDS
jgi:hypothetical protein